MTLIEVVVAAAVVMAIVVAATGVSLTARTAAAEGQGRAAADASVASEVETLRALPFDDPAVAAAAPGADLLTAVFPHADPARDTAAAFFALDARDGCAAGTFFTVRATPSGPLTIAATFLVAGAGGFRPLDPARLTGYDPAHGVCPPAAALLLRLSVPWRAGARGGTVRRTVVAAARLDGLCPVATPSPS
jgi:hypothetical protein